MLVGVQTAKGRMEFAETTSQHKHLTRSAHNFSSLNFRQYHRHLRQTLLADIYRYQRSGDRCVPEFWVIDSCLLLCATHAGVCTRSGIVSATEILDPFARCSPTSSFSDEWDIEVLNEYFRWRTSRNTTCWRGLRYLLRWCACSDERRCGNRENHYFFHKNTPPQ